MFTTDRRRLLVCNNNPLTAKYPLTSTITDTVNGTPASFTRASTKWFEPDTGAITSVTSGNPAYMGTSGILLEPSATDYALHGDFDTGWSYLHTSSVTRVTDPMGGLTALHCIGDSATDPIDVGKQVAASGFSGDSYFSLYMKSSTNWVKLYFEANGANHLVVWINLSTLTRHTQSTTGTGLTASNFVITASENGFTRVQCKLTNTVTSTMYQDYYAVDDDGHIVSGAVGTTLTLWELDGTTNQIYSTIETPDGTNRSVSPDVITFDTARWKRSNYAIYFEITPKVLLSTNTFYYEHTDASNELKLVYASGTWTLTSTALGSTKTVSVTHTPVVDTLYKVYFKVGSSQLYLEISGTSNTATGQTNGYRGTAPTLNYTDGVSIIKNFKVLRTTKLSRAEVEAL